MGEENYVPQINFSGLYNNLYELLPELPLPGSHKQGSLLGLSNLTSDNYNPPSIQKAIQNKIEDLLYSKDDDQNSYQDRSIKHRLLGQSVASALKSTSLDEFNPLISKLYPQHITTNHFKQLEDQPSSILKEILYLDPSCFNDVPLNNKQISALKSRERNVNLFQTFSPKTSNSRHFDDSNLIAQNKFVEGLSERIKKRRRRPTSSYSNNGLANSAGQDYNPLSPQEDDNSENHLEALISKRIKASSNKGFKEIYHPGPHKRDDRRRNNKPGSHKKSYLERIQKAKFKERDKRTTQNFGTGSRKAKKRGRIKILDSNSESSRSSGFQGEGEEFGDEKDTINDDSEEGEGDTEMDEKRADELLYDDSEAESKPEMEDEQSDDSHIVTKGHRKGTNDAHKKKKTKKPVQFKDALTVEEIIDTPIFIKFDNLLEKVIEQSEESDIPSLIFRKSKDHNIDDDIEIPVDSLISKQLHIALANESAKIKALGYSSMINTDKLIRVLNIFIWNIRDGSKVLPLMQESNEQEEETKLWEELAWERVFRSADCCIASLNMLTSPNISKKLFMDDVIERVIQFAKYHLTNTLYPEFDPVYKINKAKDFYVKTKRHKSHHVESKSTILLYSKINEIIGMLAELIEVQSMTDSSIILMSSLGTQPFFVENISDLQLNALRLITTIFSRYDKHRQIILEDILSSLARLPISKRNLRSYKVNAEESIQMVSALVLQLIHCIVDFPRTSSKGNESDKYDDGANAKHTPDYDVLALNSYQNANKTGHTFLAVFLKKCSARSCEEDFRTLFDHFVDDLLVTVNRPEWPASELLLTILGRILVQNFSDRKVEISLRLASLEYLGKITSRLRKDAVTSQIDNHTLKDILNQVKASHDDLSDYKNFKQEPETLKLQRLLLNYLQENSLNDPFIRFARKFIIIQWYCDILLKAHKVATANNENSNLHNGELPDDVIKNEDVTDSYKAENGSTTSASIKPVAVKKEDISVASKAGINVKKHKLGKTKPAVDLKSELSSSAEDYNDALYSNPSQSSDDSNYDPRFKNDDVVSSKHNRRSMRERKKKKKSSNVSMETSKKNENSDLNSNADDNTGEHQQHGRVDVKTNEHPKPHALNNQDIEMETSRHKKRKKKKGHSNSTDKSQQLPDDEDSLEFIEYHKRFLLSFAEDGPCTDSPSYGSSFGGNQTHHDDRKDNSYPNLGGNKQNSLGVSSKAMKNVRLDYHQSTFIAKFLSSKRSFSKNYDLYLIQIMKVVNESAIAIRTKAMKCLALIIEADPGILAHPGVQSTVHLRLKDPSPSVREAVVELMGKSILTKPELIPQYFNMLAERILDTGVSVRKRVIRILRDICVDHPNYQNITSICCKLVRRINDEEGIKKLIIEVFQTMWFNPDVPHESLDSKVCHITETVNYFMEHGSEMIETLFESLINNPEDPNYSNSYKASQQIVLNLIESIMKIDENKMESIQLRSRRLVSCLSTLYLFTKIDPELTVKHCDTLQPYLAQKCNSHEDSMIVHYVAKIFRLTVPKMGHPNPTFLAHLEESLMKLVVTQGMLVLESCIACLADIVKNVTHNYVLITDCFIKFVGILYKMALETHDNPDDINRLSSKRPLLLRSLYTVGLLCLHFDFDQDNMNISKKMFQEKLSFWETQYYNYYRKSHSLSTHSSDSGSSSFIVFGNHSTGDNTIKFNNDSHLGDGEMVTNDGNDKARSSFLNTSIQIPISECVFEIFYHFINSKDEIVKHKALNGLGFFCINHSQYLSHSKTRDMYQHFINDPSSSITIKCQALKNFYAYLLEEENKTTNANKEWDKTKNKDDFKEIGEVSSGISSAVIQIYLRDILECTLNSDASVRQSSANVLAMIIKQGLVYPVQCVPYLVAMGTDPNVQIKYKADHILKDIDIKYPGFISMKALSAARKSFELQKILLMVSGLKNSTNHAISCVRGAVVPPSVPGTTNTSPLAPINPVSSIGFLYTLLRNSKSQRRFFVDSLLKLFDEQVKVPLEELLYIADNLAYFPYVNQEEPLFVLHQMEVMTSLTGCNILQAFSECFGKDQNKSRFEDEDDEDFESLLRMIPDNPTSLYECCVASQGYFLLLHLRQFLKAVYGFTDNKLTNYSPMDTSKVFDKPVNRKATSFFNPKSTIKYIIQGAPPTEYTQQEKLSLVRQYLEFKEMMLTLDPNEEDDDDIKAIKASREAKANRLSLYKINKSIREKAIENGDISYTIEQVRNQNEGNNTIPKVHIRLNKPPNTHHPSLPYANTNTPSPAPSPHYTSSPNPSPHKLQHPYIKNNMKPLHFQSSGNIFEVCFTEKSQSGQTSSPGNLKNNHPPPIVSISPQQAHRKPSSSNNHPYDISSLISSPPPAKTFAKFSAKAALSFTDAINGLDNNNYHHNVASHHSYKLQQSSRYGEDISNHFPNAPNPLLFSNNSANNINNATNIKNIPSSSNFYVTKQNEGVINHHQQRTNSMVQPTKGVAPPNETGAVVTKAMGSTGFSYNLYENFYGGGGHS